MCAVQEQAVDAGVGTDVWEVSCSGEIHRVALVGRKLAFLDHPKGELFRGVRADLLDVDVDDERVPGCLRWLKKFQRCEHLREWENHRELVRLGWEEDWELPEEEERLIELERAMRTIREVRMEERAERIRLEDMEEAERERKAARAEKWSLRRLMKLLVPGK